MNFEQLCDEVYKNVQEDRKKAKQLYKELKKLIGGNIEENAKGFILHGNTIAQYLNLINKTNEQLLKLASLIKPIIEKSDVDNELYSDIENFRTAEKTEEESNE